MDVKLCEWLFENGNEITRYKLAKNFLKFDDLQSSFLQKKLLENTEIMRWLQNLKPENPPQHWSMQHGSFDFNLENALLKATHIGLHAGIPEVDHAVLYYLDYFRNVKFDRKHKRSYFNEILTVNVLLKAGFKNDFLIEYALMSLDELYNFCKQKNYDIYVLDNDRINYKGLPKNWSNAAIIKPEIYEEYGFGYPMIYDLIGLSSLYDIYDIQINAKIDKIIEYIACNDFHEKIQDGYGILAVEENKNRSKYHGMGWDPKLPGWFNVEEYFQKAEKPALISRLLFIGLVASSYPVLVQSKWFGELIHYLERYKSSSGIYCFPKEWFKEQQGYAVQGHHLSYGENRKKKNWCEIESTLYMVELKKFYN